jgi:hypothetical protein
MIGGRNDASALLRPILHPGRVGEASPIDAGRDPIWPHTLIRQLNEWGRPPTRAELEEALAAPRAPHGWTEEREHAALDRCRIATLGPWTVHSTKKAEHIQAGGKQVASCGWWDSSPFLDAEFIAHARSDLPAAIGEIVRLRAELYLVVEYVDRHGDIGPDLLARLRDALSEGT